MRSGDHIPGRYDGPSVAREGRDNVFRFIAPSMLYGRSEAWKSLRQCRAPLRHTLRCIVLPFALIPPLMILLAAHNHPQIFGAAPGALPWEWIAVIVLAAELASVYLVSRILHAAAPEGEAKPSRDQAYLIAAVAAVPLWTSAVVLMLPSLVALVSAHLLGHAAATRVLYRALRGAFITGSEVEAMHLVYMAYSAALVLWVLLLALFLGSLIGS